MAKCKYCNGCFSKGIIVHDNHLYYVCKFCKKAYKLSVTDRGHSISEVTDKVIEAAVLAKVNLSILD